MPKRQDIDPVFIGDSKVHVVANAPEKDSFTSAIALDDPDELGALFESFNEGLKFLVEGVRGFVSVLEPPSPCAPNLPSGAS